MGKVFRGIDVELVKSFSNFHKYGTFVETGTFRGRTTFWAASLFKQVFTIESSAVYYNMTKTIGEKKHRNISFIYGSSENNLGKVLKEFTGIAVVWLDAHWSPDLVYTAPEVICPVLSEIDILRKDGREHIIMVDDARLFGVERGWPTFRKVKEALAYDSRSVMAINDIIVSIPW